MKRKRLFILSLLLFALLFLTFRIYKIEGTSMNYGLVEGDTVLSCRFFKTIERGDLLVFEDPRPDHEGLYIKRCAALPGDRFFEKERAFYLQIESNSTKTKEIGISHDLTPVKTPNGYFLKNPYLKYYGITHNLRLTVPDVLTTLPLTTIPNDHYYLLGDYRDNSEDSRFFGAVPRKLIYSKVIYIFKKSQSWQKLINIEEADKAP